MISEGVRFDRVAELRQQAATELHVEIPKCQRKPNREDMFEYAHTAITETGTRRVRRSVNSSSSTTSAAVGGGGTSSRSLGNRLGLMELF